MRVLLSKAFLWVFDAQRQPDVDIFHHEGVDISHEAAFQGETWIYKNLTPAAITLAAKSPQTIDKKADYVLGPGAAISLTLVGDTWVIW